MKEIKDKKDIMVCLACHMAIKYTDDYAALIEYRKGLEFKRGYYHVQCFRERINGSKEMKEIQGMARNILSQIKEHVI